jgi:hypothetical protein
MLTCPDPAADPAARPDPFTALHSTDPRARWLARAALYAHLVEMEWVQAAPWPLPCPQCGHAMGARRWIGVLWLHCLFCRYKLGLAPWQERALAAAVSDPQPERAAGLLAEYALLALRVTPVGY